MRVCTRCKVRFESAICPLCKEKGIAIPAYPVLGSMHYTEQERQASLVRKYESYSKVEEPNL